MNLSKIDRLVRKLEPVDALVEKLSERLLPHKAAHAIGCPHPNVFKCYASHACGVETGMGCEMCCLDPSGNVLGCQCWTCPCPAGL